MAARPSSSWRRRPARGELTPINNNAVVAINGIRDRLRVLLISGSPHAGERTWRNLLKSDPSVDLVHFTILRPPEKQDGTPINELSLIAFPIRELFEVKLRDFDLIIFDRYSNKMRNIVPRIYIQAIAKYVEAAAPCSRRRARPSPRRSASTTRRSVRSCPASRPARCSSRPSSRSSPRSGGAIP